MSAYDKKGIPYIPIQGMVLRELYPAFALREIRGLDILVPSNGRKRVRKFLLSQGYRRSAKDETRSRDAYRKGMIIIRIHYALFPVKPSKAWKRCDRWICRNLAKPGDLCRRRMSLKQQYVCLIGHAYSKCHAGQGLGIRVLADIYYFRNSYWEVIDTEEVHRRLEDMGTAEFAQELNAAVDALFLQGLNHESLPAQLQDMVLRLMRDGVHGKAVPPATYVDKYERVLHKLSRL